MMISLASRVHALSGPPNAPGRNGFGASVRRSASSGFQKGAAFFTGHHLGGNGRPRLLAAQVQQPGNNMDEDTDEMYGDLMKKYGKVVYTGKNNKPASAEVDDDNENLAWFTGMAENIAIPRSKDPGWKYCTIPAESPNKLKCIFCQSVYTRDIHKLKNHLAGTRKNAAPCPKAPPEVKKEINASLAENIAIPRSKEPGWKYCTIPTESPNKLKCIFCQCVYTRHINRFKNHLAGTHKNVAPCPNAPPEVKKEIIAYIAKNSKKRRKEDREIVMLRSLLHQDDEDVLVDIGSNLKKGKIVGQLDKFSVRDPNVIVDERKNAKQQIVTDKLKKEQRQKVLQYIARWFYQAGSAFNTITLKSFYVMLEAIGQYGPDLRPPTMYQLREPLLKKEVEYTKTGLQDKRDEWKKSGCSIMTDAWTDRKGRSIINLYVNCKKGTSFLNAIDASADIHNAEFIFQLVDKCIEDAGKENVVQVVTNIVSANLAAATLLKDKRPGIFWTPCATHCIDLMCEGIGKLPRVKAIIQKARQLTIFIYSHQLTLSLMRKHTKGDLVRPGITRFATTFLTLQSIHGFKSELRTMFCSAEWKQSKYAFTGEGWKMANMVTNPPFWNSVALAMNIFRPLSKVLRLVDSEKKPAMGFIYAAMLALKREIQEVLQGDPIFCRKVLQVIDDKWDQKLHHPLHVAGYYLNPYFFWNDPKINTREGVMSGLMKVIETFFPDPKIQDKIVLKHELPAYRGATGPFGKPSAIRQRSDPYLDPVEWWTNHGYDTPHLQRMALRILNLTCTSSGCERNWSTFEMIHTQKRNRLDEQMLNDLVYIQFNSKLKDKRERYEQNKDPLEHEDTERAKDWYVELTTEEDEVYPGAGLTWEMVAEASGVAEFDQNRSKRNTQPHSHHIPPTQRTTSAPSEVEIQEANEKDEEDLANEPDKEGLVVADLNVDVSSGGEFEEDES